MVVESRLNPVWFNGGDIPSIAGVERRSQLFLSDGVWASIGTLVAEAQHIQGSIVLGHRARLATYPGRSSPSKVWNSPQSSTVLKLRPKRSRWNASAAANSSRSIPRSPPFLGRSPAPSQLRQRPEPAIPAGRCEERSRRSRSPRRAPLRRIPFGCHTHDCRLRPTNIPGRRALLI